MYPELMDASAAWFFNTSIAEQTNAWLGGYSRDTIQVFCEQLYLMIVILSTTTGKYSHTIFWIHIDRVIQRKNMKVAK